MASLDDMILKARKVVAALAKIDAESVECKTEQARLSAVGRFCYSLITHFLSGPLARFHLSKF
jgi:hypothetical protein